MADDLNTPSSDVVGSEPFLRRVSIRNYRSIAHCDVKLSRLTVLVGRNGAGKSNFLDALRFVVDALQASLDHAIRSRGGMQSLLRTNRLQVVIETNEAEKTAQVSTNGMKEGEQLQLRVAKDELSAGVLNSSGVPTTQAVPRRFAIELELNLSDSRVGVYGFELVAPLFSSFAVLHERLEIRRADERVAYYRISNGEVEESSFQTMPKPALDRLYLVVASGIAELREVYDVITEMGFYNFVPETMKRPQSPDAGELLHHDGGNIASIIDRMERQSPSEKARLEQYLGKIASGVASVDREALGSYETLRFRQRADGAKDFRSFPAASMSDGTLRVLGILAAVAQVRRGDRYSSLVGIEEPESALHPAAARALVDALLEGAEHTQIVITTHSADLLERIEPGENGATVLAVAMQEGETRIAPIDGASLTAVRKHLYTVGELLRMDQLEPDRDDLKHQKNSLFISNGKE